MLVLSLIVLTLAAGAFAGDATRLRANIPFAFHAGKEQLPAGQYVVELRAAGILATGSAIVLRNADGSINCILAAIPDSSRAQNPAYCLVFNRYNDDYFLATVRQNTIKADLAKTRAEKELEIAFAKGAKVQVAASKGK
jgi:hypothetical protein